MESISLLLMSSVTTTTFPTTLAYYGAGIIGFFTLASFGMKKIFGCFRWIPFSRNDLSTNVIQDLRQTLSQRDAEIAELRESLSTAENRSTNTARELEASRKEIEHVNRTRTNLEKRAREALVGKEALEHELGTRAEELATSREDANTIQEALNQTKTLLDMRTAELKVAQAFLPRSDRYAGADIMKMVESLNSEIHQTASIMADVFSPDLQGPGTVLGDGEVGLHEAAVHTEEILGEGMAKMLQTFNHQEENILLQIAFQASMCAFTEWIMDSWCYHDRDSEVEAVLQETYEQLRETEEQPVSARWRILTRKYVRKLYPRVEQPNLAYHILAACANILIISGLHESEQGLLDRLAARFADRVALIVERAVHLNNVIGDDITSCEFVPIYCTPDVAFDPSTMENATENGSATAGHEAIFVHNENKILCTTDLGLLKAEKVHGEEGTWNNTVLLKPKIVMPSGLTASPTESESPDWRTQSLHGEREES
ncbi:hypothetical protein HHX47_DHR3000539 [Lentinula edodes]|nr:hypothetical protein HHX47_DHR3000539 [Lentinula edodes]